MFQCCNFIKNCIFSNTVAHRLYKWFNQEHVSQSLESAPARLQSVYIIWSENKWDTMLCMEASAFNTLLHLFIQLLPLVSGLNRSFTYLPIEQENSHSAIALSLDPCSHMALTFAALPVGRLPDSVRHIVKCNVLFDQFFIISWSLQLFKHLTLSGAFFFFVPTCHRGLKCLQNVSRLLYFLALSLNSRIYKQLYGSPRPSTGLAPDA